jgi:hypothetical protein
MEGLTVDFSHRSVAVWGRAIMSFAICYFKDVESNPMYVPKRARGLRHPRQHQPLVIKCPKCQARLTFHRALAPSMDSCGLDHYSLECGACGVVFAGIIDPYDEALLLSEHACDAWGLSSTGGAISAIADVARGQLIGTARPDLLESSGDKAKSLYEFRLRGGDTNTTINMVVNGTTVATTSVEAPTLIRIAPYSGS